ncbi:phage tail family protein [Enterococcus avium]|uniref:phage tail family protein n=1 Tax=Enterococcus TaxID=1350 RepID=UPI00289169BD|nr:MULTISPECIES: phage tail family protein [Enterococcus]MDT2438194.1 phage tail family protein [Enterococcus avium]MDT2467866.1 phage tail family protein [Enterococcus avium]MDT2507218.1 phage tail family protein [Enterococcus avium]MDT2525956.1 phage tail family protein [Enterococcus raffinosus]MDT2593012.1 phage tail family protein [Enterococcus raffinosus]
MNGYIIDLRFQKNNKLLSLKDDLGFECIEFERKAPQLNVEYQEFSGSNGSREVNSSFKPFTIEVKLFVEFKNMFDYQLKETELYAFLSEKDSYFIMTDREPGKRYLVHPSSIDLEEIGIRYATYNIVFNAFKGCSESLSTTLSEFSLSNEWQFSQNLESADYEYEFGVSRFQVFNAGDFTIDPRENELNITLQGESLGNATIFNRTTGDRFIYYPEFSTNLGQTVTLDRVYPKLNGVNCGNDTNLNLITLAPGVNEIEIQNVADVKSSWDFRYLYK